MSKQRAVAAHGRGYAQSIAPTEKREKDDYYPTCVEATRSLLAIEPIGQHVWEPACGEGDISKELERTGRTVISSDLVNRGYGTPRVDFLFENQLLAPTIITNPPFKLSEEFVQHALDLGAEKVCMLLRLAWLEGEGRKRRIYDVVPPARVHISSRRLTMLRGGDEDVRGGGGMIAFGWFVWERGFRGPWPEMRFFDWLDHAPECWKGKVKPPPIEADTPRLFA